MIASYGPYSASATGGNALARDFLAGIAAMYASPCTFLPLSSPSRRSPPLIFTPTVKPHSYSLRACRPQVPPRMAHHHPWRHRLPHHHPHLHLLLVRARHSRTLPVRADSGQRPCRAQRGQGADGQGEAKVGRARHRCGC